MKLVFIFVALLSMALAANIDSTEPRFAVYSSPDTLPVTEHVSMREAFAILCRDMLHTLGECFDWCEVRFKPFTICPRLCRRYREGECS